MTSLLEDVADVSKDGKIQSSEFPLGFFKNKSSGLTIKRRKRKIFPSLNHGAASIGDCNHSVSTSSSITSAPSHISSRRLRSVFRKLRRKPSKTEDGLGSIQIIGGPISAPQNDKLVGKPCAIDEDEKESDDDDTIVTSNGFHKPRRNRVKKKHQTFEFNFVGVMAEEPEVTVASISWRMLFCYFVFVFGMSIAILNCNATPSGRAAILFMYKAIRGVSNIETPYSNSIEDSFYPACKDAPSFSDIAVFMDASSKHGYCPNESGLEPLSSVEQIWEMHQFTKHSEKIVNASSDGEVKQLIPPITSAFNREKSENARSSDTQFTGKEKEKKLKISEGNLAPEEFQEQAGNKFYFIQETKFTENFDSLRTFDETIGFTENFDSLRTFDKNFDQI